MVVVGSRSLPDAQLRCAGFFVFRAPRKQAFGALQTKNPMLSHRALLRGAGGIRTLVQTRPPQVFYMLIPALIVGELLEPDEPTDPLAG